MGCVKGARTGQDAGITQRGAHSLADPCILLACHKCKVDEDESASKTSDRRHCSEDRKGFVRCVVEGVCRIQRPHAPPDGRGGVVTVEAQILQSGVGDTESKSNCLEAQHHGGCQD